MIDPSDPAYVHIFEFAGCDNAVLFLARQMTLANTERRRSFLKESEVVFAAMRLAASEAWPADAEKLKTIALVEQELITLANVPSSNEFLKTWGAKRCTVCSTPITAPKGMPHEACCRVCLAGVQNARATMKSVLGTAVAELLVD